MGPGVGACVGLGWLGSGLTVVPGVGVPVMALGSQRRTWQHGLVKSDTRWQPWGTVS